MFGLILTHLSEQWFLNCGVCTTDGTWAPSMVLSGIAIRIGCVTVFTPTLNVQFALRKFFFFFCSFYCLIVTAINELERPTWAADVVWVIS